MIQSPEIRRRLKDIHRVRSKNNYLPVMVAFGISLFIQREKLLTHNLWIVCVVLLVLGAGLTSTVMGSQFEKWVENKKKIVLMNYLGLVFSGLGLGLHLVDVFIHYGGQSTNVAYTLYMIAAIVANISITLMADRASYLIYSTTLKICVISSFVYYYHETPKWILPFVIINYLYALSIQKIVSKQLRDLMILQNDTQKENNRLFSVINGVPALVVILSKDSTITMSNQFFDRVYPNLLGKSIADTPISSITNYILDFLNSTRSSAMREMKTVRNESEAWVLLSLTKLPDGGAIVISFEITELMEARHQLKEQEAKLAYTAKLAIIG